MQVFTPILAVLCALSLFCTVGCEKLQNEMDKQAIQKALHESSLTGTAPTAEHVQSLKSVDLSSCPTDFREAFSQYIHSWEEESAVNGATIKLNNEEGAAAVGGALATLFDDSSTPWGDHLRAKEQLKVYKQQADTDLNTASVRVDDVARKYGLNIVN